MLDPQSLPAREDVPLVLSLNGVVFSLLLLAQWPAAFSQHRSPSFRFLNSGFQFTRHVVARIAGVHTAQVAVVRLERAPAGAVKHALFSDSPARLLPDIVALALYRGNLQFVVTHGDQVLRLALVLV